MLETATAPTAQEVSLDKQHSTNKRLDKMKVGEKWEVRVNGVSDQATLVCVERTENPPTLKFTLQYYGVMTGKEFVARKDLNKWGFK